MQTADHLTAILASVREARLRATIRAAWAELHAHRAAVARRDAQRALQRATSRLDRVAEMVRRSGVDQA
jgi:hypothetical protein